ncbi:MAG: TRL-like family protein [Paludibacteraceae bacterium]|nr:TRL-like family protein [Paludibacteraceae bacterium]
MKKVFFGAAFFIAVGLGLTSCSAVGCMGVTDGMTGVIYSGQTLPMAVTSGKVGGKVGEAKAYSICGIVAAGNASAQEAARKAGITHISNVDIKTTGILGIVTIKKYIVCGD